MDIECKCTNPNCRKPQRFCYTAIRPYFLMFTCCSGCGNSYRICLDDHGEFSVRGFMNLQSHAARQPSHA